MFFNDHTLSGNVGRDAVLRETRNGKVLSFTLAHTSVFGEKKTDWYDVSLWGKRAESLDGRIMKGMSVVVVGSSGPDEYTDKDGNKRFKMVFRANDVQIERNGKGLDATDASDDDADSNEDLPF